MPYEKDDVDIFPGVTVVGKVSKWGSRRLENPARLQFDILTESQLPSKFCCHVTVYDPDPTCRPSSNDYVSVYGLPKVESRRMSLMAFGINVKILNRWIKKEKTK